MLKEVTIAIVLITLIAPALALNITTTAESGVVGKPASFTVKVNVEKSSETVPVDAVLVIDCSGSMLRWGNIITNVSYVKLCKQYKKIGEFKLDKQSDVEVMLQKPFDIYFSNDGFEAYMVEKDTGVVYPTVKSDDGDCVVRWWNVPPGTYEVYARAYKHGCKCWRIFCVELPPERLTLVKSATKEFVDLLKDEDRVALVEFTSYGYDYVDYTNVVVHLTDDKSDVKAAIDGLYAMGGTPMGYGLQLAIDELNVNGRANASKVIILLSDGWWNMGPDPMSVIKDAIERGYRIYTIAYGGADMATLQEIANKTGGKFYFAATIAT